MSWQQYGEDLEARLAGLLSCQPEFRVHRVSPVPAARYCKVLIPTENDRVGPSLNPSRNGARDLM